MPTQGLGFLQNIAKLYNGMIIVAAVLGIVGAVNWQSFLRWDE